MISRKSRVYTYIFIVIILSFTVLFTSCNKTKKNADTSASDGDIAAKEENNALEEAQAEDKVTEKDEHEISGDAASEQDLADDEELEPAGDDAGFSDEEAESGVEDAASPDEKRPIDEEDNQEKEAAILNLVDFEMQFGGEMIDISGLFNLSIKRYNEEDEMLLKQAGSKLDDFKKTGYMLFGDFRADFSGDEINFKLAVEPDFINSVERAIDDSGIIKRDGSFDWEPSLPSRAGEFILNIRYKDGTEIRTSSNGAYALDGLVLFDELREPLIELMIENNLNYMSIINFDRTLPQLSEYISSVYINSNSMLYFDTYNFQLVIDEGKPHLIGSFADEGGDYNVDYVKLEDAEASRLKEAIAGKKFLFISNIKDAKKDDNILDQAGGEFTVAFKGMDMSFTPEDSKNSDEGEDIIGVFKDLVKKYSE